MQPVTAWNHHLYKNDKLLQPKPATEATKKVNASFLAKLPFHDNTDFANAIRGFIAKIPEGLVPESVWDIHAYDFLLEEKEAPPTVNPSLWRQARLLAITGLFKVTERIYQVRGLDLSNITFIEGKTGVIVMDPLISAEVAKAGLEMYYMHRPRRPVTAVIYSHSHLDHFGGVKGVVSQEDVTAGKVKVIAPHGFRKEALSENVLVGNRMSRMATYMYGKFLTPGPQGHMTAGLGLTISTGTVTLIEPTHSICRTGETMDIDGLEFVFQMVPGSECQSEMHFFIPELNALCPAENACHTMHNLATPRGAQVRDALAWSGYLDELLELWGDKAEVLFRPHHWPLWGRAHIVEHIELQRDTYKYIHDQTLRLINHNFKMEEAAELIELPPAQASNFACRDYYGSLKQNVKAIYIKYLGGPFDGNPANLQPLPFADFSKKVVHNLMGGVENVLKEAQKEYDEGNYRYVAQLLNYAIHCDSKNIKVRALLADAFEQLACQDESGTYSSFYRNGAAELRMGVPKKKPPEESASIDIISMMPLETIFTYIATRLNGPKCNKLNLTMNWNFTDTQENYTLVLKNSVLNHYKKLSANADLHITLTRATFNQVLIRSATMRDKVGVTDNTIKVEGDKEKFLYFFEKLLDKHMFWFDIVTPGKYKLRTGL